MSVIVPEGCYFPHLNKALVKPLDLLDVMIPLYLEEIRKKGRLPEECSQLKECGRKRWGDGNKKEEKKSRRKGRVGVSDKK